MSARKPIITNLLVSSIAAAVLVGVWIGTPLEGSADTVSESEEAQSAPLPATKVALATTIPSPPVTEVAEAAPVEAATVEEVPVEVASLIEVPDVKRLSVWEARKQLKKQGLGFAFKQGSRRISHHDYDFYRVRSQSLVAGEQVQAGTKVTLQVKEIRFASGY
jgi:hypothetical protein